MYTLISFFSQGLMEISLRERGGKEGGSEREKSRERGWDGDRGEQRKRRIGLHSLLRPCVLHPEGGDCW